MKQQTDSLNPRRVIWYLTLAENVQQHSSLNTSLIELDAVLNHLARICRTMVLVYQR